MVDERTSNNKVANLPQEQYMNTERMEDMESDLEQENEPHAEPNVISECDPPPSDQEIKYLNQVAVPIRRRLKEVSRQSRLSIWLLAYIAIITTWPLLGSALVVVFKRKVRSLLAATWSRK